MREHAIHVAIGLTSVGLALMPFRWGPPFAGLVYFLIGPSQGLQGWWNGRRVERLAAAEAVKANAAGS